MSTFHDEMIISGAHENNLKGINLRIPKNKLVVFTGISGSGKSSLVFDTIAAEASRQLNETYPLYIRNRMPHFDPPKAALIDQLTPAIVIDQRPFAGDIRSTVGTMTDIAPLLRLLFSRCAQPQIGPSGAYSFNDPQGMCPVCGGLGKTIVFNLDRLFDKSKSLNEGAILFPGHQIGTYQWQLYAHSGLVDPDKPLCQYTEQEWFDFTSLAIIPRGRYRIKNTILFRFGRDTAALVGAHTENKALSWHERKQHTIDSLATAERRVQLLIMADKVSNLRSIAADLRTGDDVWARFRTGKEGQSWYHLGVLNALRPLENDPIAGPVFREMETLCREVFA